MRSKNITFTISSINTHQLLDLSLFTLLNDTSSHAIFFNSLQSQYSYSITIDSSLANQFSKVELQSITQTLRDLFKQYGYHLRHIYTQSLIERIKYHLSQFSIHYAITILFLLVFSFQSGYFLYYYSNQRQVNQNQRVEQTIKTFHIKLANTIDISKTANTELLSFYEFLKTQPVIIQSLSLSKTNIMFQGFCLVENLTLFKQSILEWLELNPYTLTVNTVKPTGGYIFYDFNLQT
ncbi:hypothetical protein DID75_00250 [Candidatus Marinamargulisbacteria bacterium SCGC AG-410-N11]|nr:hypothetical protein DID75_00250 [Candidatus Marinamargulisbacteria bacterium SCGC AG-410-N11]